MSPCLVQQRVETIGTGYIICFVVIYVRQHGFESRSYYQVPPFGRTIYSELILHHYSL